MYTTLRKYLLSLFILLASVAGFAQSVQLSVSPSNPGVGDTFYIMIDVNNVSGQPAKPASIPGAKVLYLQQRKMMMQTKVINGVSKSVSSASYALTVRAESAGSFTYGPITIDGVKSNSVSYKISATSTQPSQPSMPSPNTASSGPTLVNPGGSDLFLRASVSNASPYEQQAVVYTVKLYTTYSQIFDWVSPNAPSFGNCSSELTNVVARKLEPETYNGKRYYSAVIARYILYPTQSGKAVIKGNSYTGSVGQTMEYNDPVFGRMAKLVPKQVDASPNDIEMNVRPLPDIEKYDDVNGVGDFSVRAELISRNIKAHQPAIVRYTVTGTGNLSFVSLPDLGTLFPQELKFLKSEDNIKKNVGENSVSGTVTFDCTFIPQKEGEFEIPELKFYFFDAGAANWYVRKTPEMKINVSAGSSNQEDDKSLVLDENLQPVKSLFKNQPFIISESWYLLWYIIPILLLIFILIFYRRYLKRNSDLTLLKQRKASRMARRRLRTAEKYMNKGDSDKFYDEMLRSVWGYVSDKLSIPTSELNRNNVSDALLDTGVPQQDVDALITLLDESEFAKYGSHSGTDMRKTYDEACRVIDKLEESIKSNSTINA